MAYGLESPIINKVKINEKSHGALSAFDLIMILPKIIRKIMDYSIDELD